MLSDFNNSLYNYRYYPNYLRRKAGRILLYAIFLVFFNLLVTAVIPIGAFIVRIGGFNSAIERYVPDFTLSGGKLSLTEPLHYANGTIYIDVDTDPSNNLEDRAREIRTIEAMNDFTVIGNSDYLIFYVKAGDSLGAERTAVINFSDYSGMTLQRSDLYQYIPWVRSVLAFGCLILFLFKFAVFFFWTLIVAAFARLLMRSLSVRLSFGQVFRLSIYARTLPVLVESLLATLGFFFIEIALLGVVYSVYILSRVFRLLAEGSSFAGASEPQRRRGREAFRNEEIRNLYPPDSDADHAADAGRSGGSDSAGSESAGSGSPDAEGRGVSGYPPVPTPKAPDGGSGGISDEGTGGVWDGRTGDGSGNPPAPTPKTPDGGTGGVPNWGTGGIRDGRTGDGSGNPPAPTPKAPDGGSGGVQDWGTGGVPDRRTGDVSDSGSGNASGSETGGRIERGAPERPKTEKKKQPDLVLPKASHKMSIRPSDNFSFRTSEPPAQQDTGAAGAAQQTGVPDNTGETGAGERTEAPEQEKARTERKDL